MGVTLLSNCILERVLHYVLPLVSDTTGTTKMLAFWTNVCRANRTDRTHLRVYPRPILVVLLERLFYLALLGLKSGGTVAMGSCQGRVSKGARTFSSFEHLTDRRLSCFAVNLRLLKNGREQGFSMCSFRWICALQQAVAWELTTTAFPDPLSLRRTYLRMRTP